MGLAEIAENRYPFSLVFLVHIGIVLSCFFFNVLFFLGGAVYHFHTSFEASSEYPDLPSRDLKTCSILLPTLSQTLTGSMIRFEIDVLNLKYDSVEVHNANTITRADIPPSAPSNLNFRNQLYTIGVENLVQRRSEEVGSRTIRDRNS